MTARRVVIVGSGVAGGIVARRLLAAGSEVVMLEAGPRIPARDPRIWYDVMMGGRDPFVAARPSEARCADDATRHHVGGKMLSGRGGTTLHWDGWSFRLRPEDFRLRTNTGRGMDWPLSYDDLSPFYDLAEQTLRVAGDDNDRGHPPRSGPFPMPAFPYQRADERFVRAMEQVGAHAQHTCIARNTAPRDGHVQCQTIGTCIYCPLGARFTGDQLVDELERMKGFTLEIGTRALRIEPGRSSGATLVRAWRDGPPPAAVTFECDAVVVCAGAFFSPQLLLQSRSPRHPDGLGNAGGQVGRNLANHIGAAGIAAQAVNPRNEVNELYWIQTAMSRFFDTERWQPSGKFQLQQDLRHDTDLEGRKGPIVDQILRGQPPDAIVKKLQGAVFRALVPMVEGHSLPDSRVTVVGADDQLERARFKVEYLVDPGVDGMLERARRECERVFDAMDCELVTWLPPGEYAHPMGTCRMDESPAEGVVDSDLRVHGTDQVYVCGSAVFPSGGVVQPTLTVAALAHRLGAHLSAGAPPPGR